MTSDDASPRPKSRSLSLNLRPVVDADLDRFFEMGRDPAAVKMAAFVSRDPSDRMAFDAHWQRIRSHEGILLCTIGVRLGDSAERVAGHVSFFRRGDEAEIGYWVDRPLWGFGIATAALRAFLPRVSARPIFARVVADNIASTRVLAKCGFVLDRVEHAFADGRGAEVEEWVMRLD
jgi:RimJ/RimL family protein N-acetyltransferase